MNKEKRNELFNTNKELAENPQKSKRPVAEKGTSRQIFNKKSEDIMKLKKIQSLFFVVFTIMVFSSEASAKWCVVCFGKYGCMAIHAACDDFHRPKKATCRDLPIALKPSHLYKEKGGGASVEIDGELFKIASDACETFLLSKKTKNNSGAMQEVSTTRSLEVSTTRSLDEKIQIEIDVFMKTDRGFVSEKRLNQISKEFRIPITDKK